MKDVFDVIIDNKELQKATILAALEINENNYLVYSIEKDKNNSNVYISKLIDNNIEVIKNKDERNFVFSEFKKLLNERVELAGDYSEA